MDKTLSEKVKIARVASAVAFSPRTADLLKETIRIARSLNAELYLIHVGERTIEKEETLKVLLQDNGIECTNVTWSNGDPVEAVTDFCETYNIDLIIAGALDKESILKFYLGSVARNIGRKAKCNVLLISDITSERNLKRIVVDAGDSEKGAYTVGIANLFGISMQAKELILVREIHNPAMALSMADSSTAPEASKIKNEILGEELEQVDTLCKECDLDKIKVTTKAVNGKPGYAISKFAKSKKADLLVVQAPDKQFGILDRLFTHDIEYVLAELPCNVLIAKQRID